MDITWRRFEELTKESSNTNKLKLDSLGEQLRAEDGSVAYLVSYGGRVSCRGEAMARARHVRNYLLSDGRIDPARIKIIDGGFYDDWVVQLFIAPRLAPTLTKEFISKVDRHRSRDRVKLLVKCTRERRENYN